jgi:hypothetical protein
MKGLMITGAALLGVLALPVSAEENSIAPASQAGYSGRPIQLAANESNDSVVLVKKSKEATEVKQAEVEGSPFSKSKVHQYLGIATMAAAAGTFLTHTDACEGAACAKQPPRKLHNSHANLGKATAILALATVASGVYTHWDDLNKEDGWKDPDNLHVLLGAGGALMMAYAINKSAGSTTTVNHAPVAELGAMSMLFAIKMTW